ncbi:hypothetical protein [Paenibacillus lautus]|uniref:hypothetical protein n=1 Tax=Paenibacillus lautus TaxID=1401 RepID=UPI0020A21F1F|nr:hypothetical protein [Paenibacillus lautus]
MLEEITEQAFYDMIPEEVDFYRICRMDTKSIATLVDEKIKNTLQQTLESIFLKGETHHIADPHHTKIISAMTGSAIYSAAHYWLISGEIDRTDLLVDIVRPYVMNGLGLYRK